MAAVPDEKHDTTALGTHHEEVYTDKSTEEEEVNGPVVIEEEDDFEWSAGVLTNLVALLWCYFCSTWGLVVPNSAIGFITEQFPEGASKAAWIAAAVTIPNCVIQAFIGDLSDVLGRRIFLQAGCVLGAVGMIIASRGNSIEMVIGGQVLNGVGLTLGFLAVPLVAEIVPRDARAQTTGAAAMFAGIASSLGPIVQGAFISRNVGGHEHGWRTGFYLGAGFYGIGLILVTFFYRPGPRPNPEGLSVSQRLLRFDWIGIFLATAGLTIFLVGLQYGGHQYGWSSGLVLSCLILGAVCMGAFVLWEWKFTSTGIFSHELFGHPNYATCLVLSAVGGIVLFGGQAYLPQEIIALFTNDAILTGVYNLPFNLMSVVGAVGGAIVMRAMCEGKWVVVASFIFLTVGGGLMAVMEPNINYAAWFFPSALLGVAVGIQMAILVTITSLASPDHLIAAAVSTNSSIRALGGSIGVVIFGQIFQSKLKIKLPEAVSKAAIASGLGQDEISKFLQSFEHASQEVLMEIPGVTQEVILAARSAGEQAYADSYRFIWYSLIPFAVLALSLAFLLKPVREQLTRQVASRVQNAH
ncbi:hypothetical protein BDV12DRAFT_190985 [Aspergillus spectabilis]